MRKDSTYCAHVSWAASRERAFTCWSAVFAMLALAVSITFPAAYAFAEADEGESLDCPDVQAVVAESDVPEATDTEPVAPTSAPATEAQGSVEVTAVAQPVVEICQDDAIVDVEGASATGDDPCALSMGDPGLTSREDEAIELDEEGFDPSGEQGACGDRDEDDTVAYASFDPQTGTLSFSRAHAGDGRLFQPDGDSCDIYAGFETGSYASADDIPWATARDSVLTVTFVDYIRPVSTANWFACLSKLEAFDDGGYLDMSHTESANGMFSGCGALAKLNVRSWDVACMHDVSGIFDGCPSLTVVDGFGDVYGQLANRSDAVAGFAAFESFGMGQLGLDLGGEGASSGHPQDGYGKSGTDAGGASGRAACGVEAARSALSAQETSRARNGNLFGKLPGRGAEGAWNASGSVWGDASAVQSVADDAVPAAADGQMQESEADAVQAAGKALYSKAAALSAKLSAWIAASPMAASPYAPLVAALALIAAAAFTVVLSFKLR